MIFHCTSPVQLILHIYFSCFAFSASELLPQNKKSSELLNVFEFCFCLHRNFPVQIVKNSKFIMKLKINRNYSVSFYQSMNIHINFTLPMLFSHLQFYLFSTNIIRNSNVQVYHLFLHIFFYVYVV